MLERPLEIAPVVPSGAERQPITRHGGLLHLSHFQRRHPHSGPTSPPNGQVEREASISAADTLAESADSHDLESGTLPKIEKRASWSPEPAPEVEPELVDEEAVVSTKHPRFHLDLTSAVDAAVGGEWL